MRNLLTALLITISITGYAKSNLQRDEIIQADILRYVNQYRHTRGLEPLTLNPILSKEAKKHSQDMATHKLPFGHQYFDQRIKSIYQQIKGCRGGAENIAYNYNDTKVLVDGWVKSSGHRRNIQGHYNLTGIGIARDAQQKIYYTQIFIRQG